MIELDLGAENLTDLAVGNSTNVFAEIWPFLALLVGILLAFLVIDIIVTALVDSGEKGE